MRCDFLSPHFDWHRMWRWSDWIVTNSPDHFPAQPAFDYYFHCKMSSDVRRMPIEVTIIYVTNDDKVQNFRRGRRFLFATAYNMNDREFVGGWEGKGRDVGESWSSPEGQQILLKSSIICFFPPIFCNQEQSNNCGRKGNKNVRQREWSTHRPENNDNLHSASFSTLTTNTAKWFSLSEKEGKYQFKIVGHVEGRRQAEPI